MVTESVWPIKKELMMHSRQDSQVPYTCFERLSAAAGCSVEFLEIVKNNNNDGRVEN